MVDIVADVQRDVTRIPLRYTRLSDEQEVAIGRELARRYIDDSAELNREQKAFDTYVKKVGAAVAAHAKRRLPYEFHLVPSTDLINAFALPGGQVFIGEGLLNVMTTEDELANILGHEVEHIDHYHAAERIQIEAGMRRLLLGVVGEFRSRSGRSAIRKTRSWRQIEKEPCLLSPADTLPTAQ